MTFDVIFKMKAEFCEQVAGHLYQSGDHDCRHYKLTSFNFLWPLSLLMFTRSAWSKTCLVHFVARFKISWSTWNLQWYWGNMRSSYIDKHVHTRTYTRMRAHTHTHTHTHRLTTHSRIVVILKEYSPRFWHHHWSFVDMFVPTSKENACFQMLMIQFHFNVLLQIFRLLQSPVE